MGLSEDYVDANAASYNALTLAFIGDAVFERFVRKLAVSMIPGAKVRKLHIVCAAVVNCRSQALILASLKDMLNDTELSVVRRGMNSKPHSIPKNAETEDYLKATGFEALIGYLEISGDKERLGQIFDSCLGLMTEMINNANK